MKHGDLVKVKGYSRLWVCLNVTKKDIGRGVFCEKPGLYLFGGYWYTERIGGPLIIRPYGKMIPLQGRVVGKVRSHYTALRTR